MGRPQTFDPYASPSLAWPIVEVVGLDPEVATRAKPARVTLEIVEVLPGPRAVHGQSPRYDDT